MERRKTANQIENQYQRIFLMVAKCKLNISYDIERRMYDRLSQVYGIYKYYMHNLQLYLANGEYLIDTKRCYYKAAKWDISKDIPVSKKIYSGIYK